MRYAIPVLVLLGLLALFAIGLTLDPHKVPSPLIGKVAPAFSLPVFDDPSQLYTQDQLKGRPVLVNFWASWCTPCLQEHPLLMQLSRSGVAIVGLNYKDDPQAAREWLRRHGNPFALIAQDREGKAGLDWGVYGVPETFVLDADGVIRYKQIGPMTEDAWRDQIAPLMSSERASQGPA